MKYRTVELGSLISSAKAVRCGEDEYPVLSMTMHNGLVFQDEKFKKAIASKDTSNYKVVYRNQLVISFPIDEGVLAAQRIADAGIVSPAYGVWDIDQEKILPEFLEYSLRCDRAISYYKSKLRGSTARRRSLPTPTLLAFMVPLPNLDEQALILEIIHKARRLIDDKHKEIQLLDDLIKARFVEMFGTIHDNKYGYEIKTIQDVCETIKDGTHQTPEYTEDTVNGYKFLSSKDVTSGKIDWSNIKYIPEYLHKELYKRIAPRKGDLLLAKNGTTGVAAIVDVDDVFDIYVSLALLRPIDIDSAYLWGAVNSAETKEQFNANLKGIGVPNLHLGEIKKTRIIVPPKSKQVEYADFIRQVDKSKVAVQKSLEETQLLFESLMQKYFG